ncbi:MAG: glycogen synthase [Chloroflexi bacterium]|nr:glycogen synthase [Chloroflexota bacterium]
MNILFCAAEMAPLVKVGGLGDVIGGLSRALVQRGHDVRVVIPLYGAIDRSHHQVKPTSVRLVVPTKGKEEPASIWTTTVPGGVRVYLVEHDSYFGGSQVYTANDLDRFWYFSQACLELLGHLPWKPHVLHCHDWHTGGVISLLKSDLRHGPRYRSVASVFTIHNLGYQGWFDYPWAAEAGILGHIPPREHPLHPFLWRTTALGIYHADAVSTVSETYAQQILTPEYGEGLDAVVRHRLEDLYGIVNGIDYEEFDPAADPHLPVTYNIGRMEEKRNLKGTLQAHVGLPTEVETPLLGSIGRLSRQKGIPILVDGIERLLAKGPAQLVVLGEAPAGEEAYEEMLRALEARHPTQVRVIARTDESLARLIYAGSDLFLMPSLYEPCGLGQLIALRYGTVPVVRRTGGLADTVLEHPIMGNGFLFDGATDGADLVRTLERALSLFRQKEQWQRLVARAMSSDVSWHRASQKYEDLYSQAVKIHKEREGTLG